MTFSKAVTSWGKGSSACILLAFLFFKNYYYFLDFWILFITENFQTHIQVKSVTPMYPSPSCNNYQFTTNLLYLGPHQPSLLCWVILKQIQDITLFLWFSDFHVHQNPLKALFFKNYIIDINWINWWMNEWIMYQWNKLKMSGSISSYCSNHFCSMFPFLCLWVSMNQPPLSRPCFE